MDLYKDEAKIAVWPDLANNDEARFRLSRKLCFMYDDRLELGDMIRSRVEGEHLISIDLSGYSTIIARLIYDPKSGGKKKRWAVETK